MQALDPLDRMAALQALAERENELHQKFYDWYLTLGASKKDRQALMLVLDLRTLVSDFSRAAMDAQTQCSMALGVVGAYMGGTTDAIPVH